MQSTNIKGIKAALWEQAFIGGTQVSCPMGQVGAMTPTHLIGDTCCKYPLQEKREFDSEDACFVMYCGSSAWQEEQDRRSFLWISHAILLRGRNSTRSVTRRPTRKRCGTPNQKEGFCMNEPIPKLDTQHNVPRGGVTPWEQTRRVLETAEVFWLSTVRADGRPHVTPFVAVWHDGAIHFTVTYRTEDGQPAWKPTCHSDNRLQPDRGTQRGG